MTKPPDLKPSSRLKFVSQERQGRQRHGMWKVIRIRGRERGSVGYLWWSRQWRQYAFDGIEGILLQEDLATIVDRLSYLNTMRRPKR
jgi:hypothetical protein